MTKGEVKKGKDRRKIVEKRKVNRREGRREKEKGEGKQQEGKEEGEEKRTRESRRKKREINGDKGRALQKYPYRCS